MSDKDCCCDDPNAPSIKNGGNSESSRDIGPSKVMLTGSGGTGPDGEPTAFALLCGPKGLKIDMSTTGVTKAYQIDNLLMVITDGVVTFTLLSGSGIVTEV